MEARLQRLVDRIDRLKAEERESVFKETLERQGAGVCAHVEALKAGRAAGLAKLRELAGPGASGRPARTAPRTPSAPRRKTTQPSAPCGDVRTLNQLIRCLESCCGKFEKSRPKK